MKHVRTTYIEFFYPNVFMNDSVAEKVKTRKVSTVVVPKRAFGFRFFDILSATITVDGKKVQLTSERLNVSPMYYYGGKVYTVAELKRDFPKECILVRNIKENGFKKAIHCRTGNWQPFTKNDRFVEATT